MHSSGNSNDVGNRVPAEAGSDEPLRYVFSVESLISSFVAVSSSF